VDSISAKHTNRRDTPRLSVHSSRFPQSRGSTDSRFWLLRARDLKFVDRDLYGTLLIEASTIPDNRDAVPRRDDAPAWPFFLAVCLAAVCIAIIPYKPRPRIATRSRPGGAGGLGGLWSCSHTRIENAWLPTLFPKIGTDHLQFPSSYQEVRRLPSAAASRHPLPSPGVAGPCVPNVWPPGARQAVPPSASPSAWLRSLLLVKALEWDARTCRTCTGKGKDAALSEAAASAMLMESRRWNCLRAPGGQH